MESMHEVEKAMGFRLRGASASIGIAEQLDGVQVRLGQESSVMMAGFPFDGNLVEYLAVITTMNWTIQADATS